MAQGVELLFEAVGVLVTLLCLIQLQCLLPRSAGLVVLAEACRSLKPRGASSWSRPAGSFSGLTRCKAGHGDPRTVLNVRPDRPSSAAARPRPDAAQRPPPIARSTRDNHRAAATPDRRSGSRASDR